MVWPRAAAITDLALMAGPDGQVIGPHDHLSRAIRRRHPVSPGWRAGIPIPGPPLGHGSQSARQVGIPQRRGRTGRVRRQTAAREFQEETGLTDWSFQDGFERSLSYTYIRRGRKVVKTVTYFLVEVGEASQPTRSEEHVEDPHGQWFHWGTFEEINQLLYHTKIRQVFAEADAWVKK